MDMQTKSSNPVLGRGTYNVSAEHVGYGPAMTISGTVNRAGILLLLVLATAIWSWDRFYTLQDPAAMGGLAMVGAFGGFIVAMVTIFKKEWAPVTAPVYALLEGLFIGSLSAVLEMRYPGIAIEAVALTFGTCMCMLLAYRTGLIRVTQRFTLGLVAATGGVALLYLASMMLSLFHVQIPGIFGSGPIGIVFSLVVCGIAALNLVLDFNFIEEGARRGAPRFMEWYSAFGLMVTLVWLYIEILNLLAKLRGGSRR
jgi:uncharacterized YccA/Bax inhibitor family protein